MPTQVQIDNAVQAFKASEAGAQTDTRAQELVWFLAACAARNVDLVGPGFEGVTVKDGQVWFHSTTGLATGVPTVNRVKQALDVEAARRLHAALMAKFNPT